MAKPDVYITSVAHGRIVSQKLYSPVISSARSALQGGGDTDIAQKLSEIPDDQPVAIWQARTHDPRSGALYTFGQISPEKVEHLLAHFAQSLPQHHQLALSLGRGTIIRTSRGDIPVEMLRVGDMITTLDDGPQPLRWIGARRVRAAGDFLPIRLHRDVFGPGSPNEDLLVSPRHRVVIRGWQAEVLFGQEEVLCIAKGLINGDSIQPATDLEEVEYYHLLFDRHQLIYTNNTLSESLNPSDTDLNKIESGLRDEIFGLFPKLRQAPKSYGPAVRMVVTAKEAMLIWGS